MATIKPFKAVRPHKQYADRVASLPYDVYSSSEAKAETESKPYSFLRITKSEVDLPDTIAWQDQAVYEKAKDNLQRFLTSGLLYQDNDEALYVYRQEWNGRVQVGLAGLVSIAEYAAGIIKKHEFTRPDKEGDRINHIVTTGAQTGMVFLAYKSEARLKTLLQEIMLKDAEYDFVSDNGVRNTLYKVSEVSVINELMEIFAAMPALYIADGHHRSEAAFKSADALGTEYFLAVLFAHDELEIMDYNRVIKDLNGFSCSEFMQELAKNFSIHEMESGAKPSCYNEFSLYLSGQWYKLVLKSNNNRADVLQSLDVNILQNLVLQPLLNIGDPRTDKRINFVGGIRGVEELQKLVDSGEYEVAFALYPPSISDLFAVADSNRVMPPKSTWFEPKLLDGLLVHKVQ